MSSSFLSGYDRSPTQAEADLRQELDELKRLGWKIVDSRIGYNQKERHWAWRIEYVEVISPPMPERLCKNCEFFEQLEAGRKLCHRYPPIGDEYAYVSETYWCGEFIPKAVNEDTSQQPAD